MELLDATPACPDRDTVDGSFQNKDVALAVCRQRKMGIKAALPADRLLIFDVAEGWNPKRSFPKLPMPDTLFPNENLEQDFWGELGRAPPDAK